MKNRNRRLAMMAALAFAVLATLAFAFVSDAAAKPYPVPFPPEDCGCTPAYIGPNGGVCQPLGCVRPGGACAYDGDCY